MTPHEPLIVRRAEWGAKAAPQQPIATPLGIVLHHTASANRAYERDPFKELEKGKALMQSIQRRHMDPKSAGGNAWCDFGPHFVVTRGGIILEGRTGSILAAERGKTVWAAHTGETVGNHHYYGIELEGNFVAGPVWTPQQMEKTIELCAWLCLTGKIQSAEIYGHRQRLTLAGRFTECPGKLLDHLPIIRKMVHDVKAAWLK